MIEQASSRNCFVCGLDNPAGLHIQFYESGTDPIQVTAEYQVPEKYQGYPGIVHGGIVATMLDEVTARTVFRGESPRLALTARLSIRYRKPVPVATPIKLIGEIVKDNGKIIDVAGKIYDLEGNLLAEADAVLVEVDPHSLDHFAKGEEDWRVYPKQSGLEQ